LGVAGLAALAATAVIVIALAPWLAMHPLLLALIAVALALPGARLLWHRRELLALAEPGALRPHLTGGAQELRARVEEASSSSGRRRLVGGGRTQQLRAALSALRGIGRLGDLVGPISPPALALSAYAAAAAALLALAAPAVVVASLLLRLAA
jgi:hypothetical protein